MYNDELYHTGRKGMKWGQHIYGRLYKRSDGSLTELGRKRARAYAAKYRKITGHKVSQSQSDDKTTKAETIKEKSVSEMSDSELQSRINRLQLEQRYNQLKPKKISSGKKFIETVFKPAASEASKQLMKEWMIKAGKEAMGLNNNNNNNNNNRRNHRSSTA